MGCAAIRKPRRNPYGIGFQPIQSESNRDQGQQPVKGYALPISPKKPMKSMLLAKSHIAEFVDDFGLVGNA
jgi:hypothetical protein